ncbi:MAG: GHKL domain-containing protein [Lachnospiraceae bacterium]
MMLEFWDKISYMVQLLSACIIFMVPARKRNNFILTTSIAAVFLVTTSFLINTYLDAWRKGPLSLMYWAFYIVVCILFVWCGLEGSFLQAVYCAICGSAMQHLAFDFYLVYYIADGRSKIISFMIYVFIYVLFYQFFAKRLPEQGRFAASKKSLIPITTIILLVWILSILENSSVVGFEAGIWHRVIYRIIDALCCIYVLWVQINQKERMSLQREIDGINSAWNRQKKQYEVTSETIESINRKCHDLKHQISSLRQITDEREKDEFIDELEQDIMIYDSALSTGNKALDTVLMEKGLFCKNHGIQWSCMADGKKLDFMRLEDIYAIFGNALDNAIEAVMDLKDYQKRVISVKIVAQKCLLMIQVQNYFEKELHFENGLPLTTKNNKRDHGYGMKSIQHTAEKYNGTITVQVEDQIFMLQILIPVGSD